MVTNANRLRTFRPRSLPEGEGANGFDVLVEVGSATSEREEVATVLDPVCGMEVDPEDAAGTEEYEGQTYYFCSEGCHERFKADPDRYASPRAS